MFYFLPCESSSFSLLHIFFSSYSSFHIFFFILHWFCLFHSLSFPYLSFFPFPLLVTSSFSSSSRIHSLCCHVILLSLLLLLAIILFPKPHFLIVSTYIFFSSHAVALSAVSLSPFALFPSFHQLAPLFLSFLFPFLPFHTTSLPTLLVLHLSVLPLLPRVIC